jgi:hypothetical protein
VATEELTLRIRGDIRDIKSDFRAVETDGDRAARRVGDSFERAGRRINGAFRAIRTGALAAVAAGGGLAILAQRSLAAAENIQDLADRADVSAEFLQELRFVTNQSGASARDFDDAISRLNRRFGLYIQNLRTGEGEAGPAAAAFRALGLESDITSGRIANSEQAFYAAVEALQDVESAAQRSALASQLFGEDSGPRLVGLLNRGTEGIRNLASEARALGVVIDNEMIRRGAEASDQLEILGTVLRANVTAAFVEAAPEIQAMAEAFTRVLPGMIDLATRLGDQMARAFGFAGSDPTTTRAAQDRLSQIGQLAAEFANRGGGPGRRQTEAISILGREQIAAINRQVFEEGRGFLVGDILRGGQEAYERQGELIVEALRVEAERVRQLKRELEREVSTALSPVVSGVPASVPAGVPVGVPTSATPRLNPNRVAQMEIDQILLGAQHAGFEMVEAAAQELQRQNQRIADTFGRSAADGVLSALDGNLDVFLARMFRQAALNGLSEAFSAIGSAAQGRGGLLGGLFGFGARLLGGGKATGGPARGLTLVGEQGPELVNLGAMANVMTANMTRMALAGGRAAAPSAAASPVVNLQTTVIDQSRGVDVQVRQISRDEIAIMIDERAPRAVAGQMYDKNSPVGRSMRSNFQVTPRRGNV